MTTDPRVQHAVCDLEARYEEPWRAYHTREHVEEMLAALIDLTGDHLHPALELGAWVHDAVYDAHAPAGVNERASAELGRRVLTDAGLPAHVVDEVADLTLATIDHELPDHLDPERRDRAAAFLDADLWILASPPDRFDRYELQVREEYAFVPEHLFRQGRAAILAGFAARERLYLTERALTHWEPAARRNLARIGHHGNPPQSSSS